MQGNASILAEGATSAVSGAREGEANEEDTLDSSKDNM
jgi:hypothetical protein